MDGSHEGSRLQSIKWTDSTKGQDSSPQRGRTQQGSKNLMKSTKWTDPTKGQDSSPQSGQSLQRVKTSPQHGWIQQGSKNLNKSTKWTDTMKGQDSSPQSGRSLRMVKIPVRRMDGPHNEKIYKSTRQTDTTRISHFRRTSEEADT